MGVIHSVARVTLFFPGVFRSCLSPRCLSTRRGWSAKATGSRARTLRLSVSEAPGWARGRQCSVVSGGGSSSDQASAACFSGPLGPDIGSIPPFFTATESHLFHALLCSASLLSCLFVSFSILSCLHFLRKTPRMVRRSWPATSWVLSLPLRLSLTLMCFFAPCNTPSRRNERQSMSRGSSRALSSATHSAAACDRSGSPPSSPASLKTGHRRSTRCVGARARPFFSLSRWAASGRRPYPFPAARVAPPARRSGRAGHQRGVSRCAASPRRVEPTKPCLLLLLP